MTRCAVCGMPAHMQGSLRTNVAGGGMWYHEDGSLACVIDGVQMIEASLSEGHKPVCDFCNDPNVTWTLIGRADVHADMMVYDDKTMDVMATATHNLSADWATCDECKRLIDVRAVTALAYRALANVTGREMGADVQTDEELLSALVELHETVLNGMVGWQAYNAETGEGAGR